MSLVPINTLLNSGPATETALTPPTFDPQESFSRALGHAESPNAQATPLKTDRQATTPPLVGPPAASSVAPAANAALQSKLEYTANSLATAKQRVAAVNNTGALLPLQNRLAQLETRLQTTGSNLKQTGANADPAQLLKLQNDVYQLDEELEIMSKVVEQATSGIKSVLQIQI